MCITSRQLRDLRSKKIPEKQDRTKGDGRLVERVYRIIVLKFSSSARDKKDSFTAHISNSMPTSPKRIEQYVNYVNPAVQLQLQDGCILTVPL